MVISASNWYEFRRNNVFCSCALTDFTDDLFALQDLEKTLHTQSQEVAAVLRLPPSDGRSAQIRAIWPRIASQQVPYAQMIQRLRALVGHVASDTPLAAAERRALLCHGPVRERKWTSITEMVSRQLVPTAFPPLITERTEIVRGPEFGPVNYVMNILFDLANPLNKDADLLPDTHYRDIPLSGAYFINLLQAAQRILLAQGHSGPVRFIDIGCGGGTKVLAASAMFEVAHGLEYSPAYAAKAQQFLERLGVDAAVIRTGDALTFEDYGAYDVIYFYRPLKDPALAAQMEARVLAQARPGTVILAPLNATLGRSDDDAGKVLDKIYLAGISRSDAQKVAEQAEMRGCETRIRVSDDATALGFWEPIVTQSRRNGFAPR